MKLIKITTFRKTDSYLFPSPSTLAGDTGQGWGKTSPAEQPSDQQSTEVALFVHRHTKSTMEVLSVNNTQRWAPNSVLFRTPHQPRISPQSEILLSA